MRDIYVGDFILSFCGDHIDILNADTGEVLLICREEQEVLSFLITHSR